MTRFLYAMGYRSREAAKAAMIDAYTEGRLTLGENPRLVIYATVGAQRYWAIEIDG